MTYLDDLFGLKGKVVLITGGAGVLASEMAKGLGMSGCRIVILDLRSEPAEARAGELKNDGIEAIGIGASVLEKDDLLVAREKVITEFGSIDILINAAGGNMPGATIGPEQTFFDLKLDDLKKVMDLNFIGSVLPSQVFGETMADQGKGAIINISSMAAGPSITRVMGYSASKAGISNFTRWLAVEMARKFGEGIRVNAIAPGFFIGEQNRRLLTNEDGSFTERGMDVIRKTPMGRFGEARELIGAVLYLAGDSSGFVTGVVLPVDGGFSAFSGV